jgi:hypothetical protein
MKKKTDFSKSSDILLALGLMALGCGFGALSWMLIYANAENWQKLIGLSATAAPLAAGVLVGGNALMSTVASTLIQKRKWGGFIACVFCVLVCLAASIFVSTYKTGSAMSKGAFTQQLAAERATALREQVLGLNRQLTQVTGFVTKDAKGKQTS